MYFALCYVFYLIFQLPPSGEGRSFDVIIDDLGVGNTKSYVLNNKIVYMIEIRNISDVIERVPPRIYVECEECNENHPVLVVVSQNKGVLSWELPLVIDSNNYHGIYKNIERTLCPYDIKNTISYNVMEENITHPVTIALSTSSHINKKVDLLVNLEENFVLEMDKNKTVEISVSTPAYYLFEFPPENVTSVLLEVDSKDEICLIVSVQNVSCPVFDLEENIAYRGRFQTVTRKGGLTLSKEAFPNGFYVVLIVRGEEKYCSGLLNSLGNRTKNIVITVSKSISVQDYNSAVALTVGVILLFCIIMFLAVFFSIQRAKRVVPNQTFARESSASSFETLPSTTKSPTTPNAQDINADSLSVNTDSSLDEADFDCVKDAGLDKDIIRMKNFLYLCDLSRKNQSVLKKKSDLYFKSILTVAIFYFLPVIQLVFSDEFHVRQFGEEDLCYYNFLCSHPLWWFSDFNHIFSNIGYIAFGILFMFLTAMKERHFNNTICADRDLYKFYGIPQHFGLFYAMGAALIVEGVLSSCYHVCPSHSNFQFDSSFMYVICTLCMIKIYHTRHPDLSVDAYTTFFLMSGVIFMGFFGVFNDSLSFWIVFTIFHLSTCTYLSLKVYYMGRWKLSFINFARGCKELLSCRACNLRYFRPMFPSRFSLLLVANIFNWSLAVGSFFFKLNNFCSYLLTIFMVNLLLYTAFYILMKFFCHEKLLLESVIYILLAMVCWGFALYFFLNKTLSWKLTPAQSKLLNQKCILLDFYDNHDVWHFISAAAMFFSFMVLLTLDDDLVAVHRSNIVVF